MSGRGDMMRKTKRFVAVFVWYFLIQSPFLLFLLAVTCQPSHAIGQYGLDLQGQPVQLAGPGIGAVVLIFAATDCPISNRYVPEIARLNRKFLAQGVRIWWVFPNPADTAGLIAQHNRDFVISEPTLLDTRQTLVHLAHVSITPEAAVFKWDGTVLRVVYRSRIDDRYLSLGQERPQPPVRVLTAETDSDSHISREEMYVMKMDHFFQP